MKLVLSSLAYNIINYCVSGTTPEQFKLLTNWSLYGIEDETLDKLFNKGYTSVAALKLIKEEDLKFLRSVIENMGQITLLRGFVGYLNCKQHRPTYRKIPSNSNAPSTYIPSSIPSTEVRPNTQSAQDLRYAEFGQQDPTNQNSQGILFFFIYYTLLINDHILNT